MWVINSSSEALSPLAAAGPSQGGGPSASTSTLLGTMNQAIWKIEKPLHVTWTRRIDNIFRSWLKTLKNTVFYFFEDEVCVDWNYWLAATSTTYVEWHSSSCRLCSGRPPISSGLPNEVPRVGQRWDAAQGGIEIACDKTRTRTKMLWTQLCKPTCLETND